MKRTALQRYTPLKRTGFSQKATRSFKQSKKSIKPSARSKKIARNRDIREQYDLPSDIKPSRWGTNKTASRTDFLKGMLWTVFARYIRERDEGKCISCGAYKTYEDLQAGHYVPVGGNSLALCFDEHNVNGECPKCNAFDQMHLVFMRPNLIVKWGLKEVERLEFERSQKQAIKWEEIVYVEKIRYYYSKLNKLTIK